MKPIVVVGSSNTDLVANVERLPGEGETVMGTSMSKFAGGKGANQAVAAVRTGAKVAFVGAVGTDAFGDETVQAFEEDGLDLRFLKRTEEAPSGTALICVDQNGRNQIVVVPGANGLVGTEQIDSVDFSEFGIAVFQHEIPHEAVWHGLKKAHAAGCITILNPAPAAEVPAEILTMLDYLVPNEHELKIISEKGGSFEEMVEEMLSKGVKNLIVTLGAEGAACFSRDGNVAVPAPDVAVKDTVGAGDCFVGVFAASLYKGCDLEQSLRYAAAGASLSVTKVGAQASYVGWDEIEILAARAVVS
ncbi:ribokinase [Tichowtungia aerotolerans]|uniref:Ribokinase n=1 Tax=Tichowtungia aerotolerans TaxID=2697043 RepID=A0A6P1MCP2_9BACT|nr:ribokinase [Tichowtungia aerotolerans]QHI70344.1 ribokinase [Tichowtungia aerotolerans]